MNPPSYETMGRGYREIRRPDRRIAATIWAALGDDERRQRGRGCCVGLRLIRADVR